MWQDYERDAWLGPALEQMGDEQLEAFDDAARQIFDRYPVSDDDPAAGAEALSGALMVILGDDTLEGVAGEWSNARAAERDAMARLTGAIVAEAVQGQPETTIAERAGVNRMTVRKALGK